MKYVDKSIWRGPHIDAGYLYMRGFTATLDLESGRALTGDNSPLAEAVECFKHNIRVWPHPLGTFFPPTLQELREGAAFLETFPGKIYVHCARGVDRTGMIVATYRILHQGWDRKRAIMEMLDDGFHLWAYFFWIIQLYRIKPLACGK